MRIFGIFDCPKHRRVTLTKIPLINLFTNRLQIFKYFFVFAFVVMFCDVYGAFQAREPRASARKKAATESRIDSSAVAVQQEEIASADSTAIDSSQVEKEFLDASIDYQAKDSIVMDEINKLAYLYNEAKVTYGDIVLDAGYIIVDYANSVAYARGIPDTLGNYSQKPILTQGDKTYDAYALTYNFKTQKAYIKNVKTEESEGYGTGRNVKKENDEVYYARDFYFSTDEKLRGWIDGTGEETDYYIRSSRVKMTAGKSLVAGPSQLYIADVPTPLVLPFAFFPMNMKPTSGVILPSYNVTKNQGFGLIGGGVYLAINDYVHARVTGDIYTKGSWTLNTAVNYIWKYHFSGSFNFNYGKVINGEIGLPGYSKSTPWQLSWTHTQDPKMNPNLTLSASVNMSSSKYYTESIDQLYNDNYITNSVTSSSINFSKRWNNSPFNLNVTIRQSQNNSTGLMSMTLPQLTFTMSRIFPFKKKNSRGDKWYEKINVSWTMNGQNDLNNVPTDMLFTKQMWDYSRNGIKHSIPINANYKILKYFTLNLGVNYSSSWYFSTIKKTYDADRDTLLVNKVNGFKAYRNFSLSASLNTVLYGMFNFGNKGKLKAIRHIFTPSIGYSFRPDFSTPFWNYFEAIQTGDRLGAIHYYSYFEEGIFDKPSYNSMSQSMTFSFSNSFEAKIGDKADSTKTKKIKLLDQLNTSFSYNFAAAQFKLSTIPLTGGTSFFNGRIGWNFRFTFDPYALDENGQRVDKYAIKEGQGLLRMTQASTAINFTISSEDFVKKDQDKEKSAARAVRDDSVGDADVLKKLQAERPELAEEEEAADSLEGKRKRPKYVYKIDKDSYGEYKDGYWDYRPQWSLSFSYSFSYDKPTTQSRITNSLPINGNINFSDKWSVGFSTSYDFEQGKISNLNLNFARDLNTWHFTFAWAPISPWASYSFFIGVKANILQDLKMTKRDNYENTLFND